MQHKKKIFFIFFLPKTQALQLIAIKDNKPCSYILKVYKKTEQSRKKKAARMTLRTQPGYWPKPVTGSATVACICMLQWLGN
jgi:hypothetical protein